MPTPRPGDRRFDLTPHPRILAMLGEIVLPQWRCIAELIDNSVDAFLVTQRANTPTVDARIAVHVPTSADSSGTVTIRDNGPGMDIGTLERAARAGWTSHDPINNLGLFGMGFNIATARLGTRTMIWTTCSGDREWVGMEIDFDRLTNQESFVTPAMVRAKPDPAACGTEIEVTRLKPEQRDWFARANNRSTITRHLARVYSAMLAPGGVPTTFRLDFNGRQVVPRRHCVWGGPGNETRSVDTARHGVIDAFQSFDTRLNPRPFCQQCWNWLPANETACPFCGELGDVVTRERRVHGWLGIQRYLDQSDFGVDFLRNGRKLELGNKDLFNWYREDTDSDDVEYPIDDPRGRGRIVGEVHIDHCRVPYTKDRFVREDAAWQEMMDIVRGRGPLRPDIASRLGAPENTSPLFRLFQAFRRSSPHNKRMAGAWSKILVVPDNDRALAMSKRFHDGTSEFQTDDKWWELIEEAERALLTPDTGADRPSEGVSDTDAESDTLGDPDGDDARTTGVTESELTRFKLPSLSDTFVDDLSGQRFEVEAYSVQADDPALGDSSVPWAMQRDTGGIWQFLLNDKHPVFRSATMTPRDALLSEMAWFIKDFERGHGARFSFSQALASLRSKYEGASRLDVATLRADAVECLRNVGAALV